MNIHPRVAPTDQARSFDQIVCLRMEAGWCYVEGVEQAVKCLTERFEYQYEPSWQRAYETCRKALEGDLPAEAAKNAFIVAAMAAGIQFELASTLDVMERHVEEAASDSLASALLLGNSFDLDEL